MAAVPGNYRLEKDDTIAAVNERLNVEAQESAQSVVKPKAAHKYDGDQYLRLWNQLRGWLSEEKDLQFDNRVQMAIDEDYRDHQQWRAQDAEVLTERGQAPLAFNRIFLAINWLDGTAMRTKTDWKVRPREEDDVPFAPAKTKLLKYVDDANHAVYHRLDAFRESISAGISWLYHGINFDPEKELVEVGKESWRYVWHDSRCRKLMIQGGRYIFLEKTLDEDVGMACWPDRADVISQCATSTDPADRVIDTQDPAAWDDTLDTGLTSTGDNDASGIRSGTGNALSATGMRRRRFRATECWYRVARRRTTMQGQLFRGKEYNPNNKLMAQAVREQVCTLRSNVGWEVRYAIWCDRGLLIEGKSPFNHNEFPLVPVPCYQRAKDGAFFGVVRGMRDAQDDYNKRASKALHILSTKGIFFDEGAFDDEDEARDEFARPDYFLGHKKGYKVEPQTDIPLADSHLKLMEIDAQHMESASGVTNELLALQTQAVSGKAIEKRQQQGQLTTTRPFEMFRLAQQMSGEITLSLCQQFHTAEFTFRVTDEQGKTDDFQTINRPEYNFDTGEWEWMDDITKTKSDFVIDETDYRESVRQSQFEVTMDYISRLDPALSIKFLDLAMELSDVDNKEEWVKRIRKINGEPDPNEEKTPEGQQAALERQQQQAEQEMLQKRGILAEITKKEGEAAKAQAGADTAHAQSVNLLADAILKAMQAAGMVVTTPGVTPAADVMLESAGFPQFPAQISTAAQAPQPGAPPVGPSPAQLVASRGAGPMPQPMGGGAPNPPVPAPASPQAAVPAQLGGPNG